MSRCPLGWLMRDTVQPKRSGSTAATAAVLVCLVGIVVALIWVARLPGSSPILEGSLVAVGIGVLAMTVIVPKRSHLLRAQTAALVRQGSILRAAAFSAERLAGPDGSTSGLHEALARFGETADVDRVYLYENRDDPNGGSSSILGNTSGIGSQFDVTTLRSGVRQVQRPVRFQDRGRHSQTGSRLT